jgi:hypothetical protein
MRAAPRHRSTLGLILGLALVLGHGATALAARPATYIDAASALRVLHGSPSATSLHAGGARGGQRGGQSPAARHQAPTPPVTRAADPQPRSSILVRSDDGRRRPSDLRATLVASAQRRRADGQVHVGSRDQHDSLPAALFYEANAPPTASAQTLAGLDA